MNRAARVKPGPLVQHGRPDHKPNHDPLSRSATAPMTAAFPLVHACYRRPSDRGQGVPLHAAPSKRPPRPGQRRRRDDDDHPPEGRAAVPLGPITPEDRPVAGESKGAPCAPTSKGTWGPPLVPGTRGRGKPPCQAANRRENRAVTTLFSPPDVRMGGEHRVPRARTPSQAGRGQQQRRRRAGGRSRVTREQS